MKKRKLNKKKLVIFILIVVSICSALGFGIYSFAKYIAQVSDKILIIPANFKFDSDYLKSNNPTYNIYNWDDGLSIDLYNSMYTNKSEVDILYIVTVTNGNYTLSNGTNNITCPNDVCTFLVSEDKHIINVTPINTANPVIVSVSSQDYDYTLSATFSFEDAGNNSYYSFVDEGNYSKIIIETSSYNTNVVSINWDSNYVPDTANPLMESWTNSNATLSLLPNSEYTLIFFEKVLETHNPTIGIIRNNTITLP